MSEALNQQQVAIIRSMGGLVFDAVFEETHEADLEVTDNPVETGVVVSDHAFMKPLRVKISAGVSDTPLAAVTDDPFASDAGRSRRAFELLTELQRRAEPFDLQTGLKLYENMVCTSIRTSQDKDSSGALLFTAELREVIIVYTQVVTYPPRKPGATKRQAGPKKDKGEQQGKEVTNSAEKKSLIKKGADALWGKK
ncbi:MAG: phage baseplate protein [Azospira sp.]